MDLPLVKSSALVHLDLKYCTSYFPRKFSEITPEVWYEKIDMNDTYLTITNRDLFFSKSKMVEKT